jgi:hypothetical protein
MHGACVVIDNAYTVLRIQGNGHNNMGGIITIHYTKDSATYKEKAITKRVAHEEFSHR